MNQSDDTRAALARIQLVRLAALVESHATVEVLRWPEVAHLMLENMARMARAIANLSNSFNYEAAILCRCLFEHSVKFSWLCIDPMAHLERWGATDIAHRTKAIRHASEISVDEIATCTPPLLQTQDGSTPSLVDMCKAVDGFLSASGAAEADAKRYSTEGPYLAVYRNFSAPTHGELTALQALVHQTPNGLHCDLSAPFYTSAFTIAPFVLANAFLLAAKILGYPDESDVVMTFERHAV